MCRHSFKQETMHDCFWLTDQAAGLPFAILTIVTSVLASLMTLTSIVIKGRSSRGLLQMDLGIHLQSRVMTQLVTKTACGSPGRTDFLNPSITTTLL